MLALPEKGFISSSKLPLAPPLQRKTCTRRWNPPSAKKQDVTETSPAKESIFQLKASKPLLARAAVAVLGLGFVDAGYSGDWSRIGVVSKGTEELLKAAAFLVVPLCLFLIYSISGEEGEEGEEGGD